MRLLPHPRWWYRLHTIRLLVKHPGGISDQEIANALGCSRRYISKIRLDLHAEPVRHGLYTYEPSDDDVRLALAVLERRYAAYPFPDPAVVSAANAAMLALAGRAEA